MFYDGKTVLVTGGAGFVGTHIIGELLRYDVRIRVPVHNRPMILRDPRIETVPADLTNEEDCRRVSEGVDCLFHAAGAVSAAAVTAKSPMGAITTNLILTARVLQAAGECGIKRSLVFSSSTGYPPAAWPIREEEMWMAEPYPGYFGYGWMRRYLEKMASFVMQKSSMGIAVVRPTAVYGPWDNFDPVTSHVVPALIRKAVERMNPYEVWGTGDEVRDFLHVRDLARGCLLMLEHKADGDPVNIGYGRGFTVREMITVILAAAGYADAKLVFDSSKPSTIPFRVVDTSKAKRLFGFEPEISFEDGLRETVAWYRGNQNRVEG